MSLAAADFAFVRDLVQKRSAIVLDSGKEYLVESRLLPVARAAGESSVADLIYALRRTKSEKLSSQIIEAMTTNETSWFRDAHPYTAMSRTILPELLESRAKERQLDIWSAACSTGQEAYTIAMLASEAIAGRGAWRIRITATDLSTEMVARTKAGTYSQLEVNRGLPATKLVRHFERAGTMWQVKSELREMVSARQMNLAAPFTAIPTCDVIFLRNVLIYFDLPTKRAVLDRVRRVLRPDGYLFLGGAETTLNVHEGFERIQIDRATVYKLRP